jgi:hypothetical protein
LKRERCHFEKELWNFKKPVPYSLALVIVLREVYRQPGDGAKALPKCRIKPFYNQADSVFLTVRMTNKLAPISDKFKKEHKTNKFT